MRNLERRIEDNKSIIADLKSSWDPSSCRCFVDVYLNRQLKAEVSGLDFPLKAHYYWWADPSALLSLQKSEIENSHYHEQNLVNSLMNLFAAGTDTTALTLQWSLLFMAKFPRYQSAEPLRHVGLTIGVLLAIAPKSFLVALHPDQVQEELTRVVGSRQVRVEDRKDLPFTDAVIHESQRMCNIGPLAIPHKTSRDVTFEGYFLEKVHQDHSKALIYVKAVCI